MRDDPHTAERLRDLAAKLKAALEAHGRPHYPIRHPDGRVAVVTFWGDGTRVFFDFTPDSTLVPCPSCRQHLLAQPYLLTEDDLLKLVQSVERGLVGCLQHGHIPVPGRSIYEEQIDIRPQRPAEPTRPAEPRIRVVPPTPAEPPAEQPPRIAFVQRALTAAGPNAHSAPEIAYDLPNGYRVMVVLAREVCEALIEHARESNQHGREIGGVLAGYKHETARGGEPAGKSCLVIATDIIPVSSHDASGAHVRLDEEAWVAINDRFDSTFTPQGKVRLGWYHTHPTQGIFFSNLDLDAHTVFTSPHQFALVIDPRTMDAGLFYWDDYGQRRLAGPVRFSLRRERDWTDYSRAQPAPGTAEATESAPKPPERGPLDGWRVTLFGMAAVLAVAGTYWLTGGPLLHPTPELACVLALTGVVGLRLWGAGVFHPVEELPYRPPVRRPARRPLTASASELLSWSRVLSALPYIVAVVLLVAVLQVVLWTYL
jgi:proteasome lid subunit RPN8/RPN11